MLGVVGRGGGGGGGGSGWPGGESMALVVLVEGTV